MAKNADVNCVFSQDGATWAYIDLIRIRKFEEKCGQIYGMGQIAGFCHLCIGQEAISVALKNAMKKGDSVITGYRDHGHNMAVGTEMKYILAELMGKETGSSKGKGGSMHLFDTQKGFFGGHGIVGAQISLGAGLAFAHKYNETDNVCFAFCGDGAANQGQVYESMNMAKIWNLPVLFVVENNRYAMGTSTKRHSASENFYTRAAGYNIPAEIVDGSDLNVLTAKFIELASKIRKNGGPIFLEIDTYRYRGHSMSDPGKYRSKEEVENRRENHDPITIFEKFLLEKKWINQDKIDEIEAQVKLEVQDAYDFCLSSNEPCESALHTNVYIES
ncbi:pyruvate dehydrogenase (acetyl-transferring) E1 component subunit alpha [Candidatus Deianiraea vastatrix]|uniref:Pyruvate dehydrogenase E1 component subunit alpha n=1 Tax=Candidatus Deianiraea vastatrix TaxID=2163644 RepID=A0A5B8XEA0_9RICK|nr:pyruvate dehydrogenase (acetyl-transferring) E1 component subunit alpha [Candidatus Deianiraea vastatrix]QED23593.1 Pyruvate dehydrogenase E1 subunit alpha [Candidatus Deianiraea vastatrix]